MGAMTKIIACLLLVGTALSADLSTTDPRTTSQRDRDALEAAVISSNAAHQASQPQQFPTGIESASIGIAQTNGSVVGLAVTPSLDVIGYLDHASPRTGWEQRRDAAVASNEVRRTALKALKNSPAYTTLTNQLAQYDGHYAMLTNLIATADLSKTNKVQDIITKQRQATDDLHDAVVKLVKLVKELAGNQ
jgi:hypothetical protein